MNRDNGPNKTALDKTGHGKTPTLCPSMWANYPNLASVWLLGLLGFLTGCVTGLTPAVVAFPEMPTQYRNVLTTLAGAQPSAVSPNSDAKPSPLSMPFERQWWRQYASEQLNFLVAQSLETNPELRIANWQIEQAGIRARQAAAGKLPKVSAPLVAVAQSPGGSADLQQSSQIGLQASLRLDLWGEQSALMESAHLQYWRAVHARENIQINLLASLVSNYLAYLSVIDALASADQQLAIASAWLETVLQRLALGDASLFELEQQRQSLYALQSLRAGLDNQHEELRSTLARLVGVTPAQLQLTPPAEGDKNQQPSLTPLQFPVLEVGLPSSLLLRRPDIRMMESRLRAAHADIDVARARLLPSLDLTAQASYSAMSVAKLLQPQNLLLTSLASLTFSVFDAGFKRDEQAFAQAVYAEMLETYRMTVLQAIREVEVALSALRAARLRWQAQTLASQSNASLLTNASDAYSLAAIDSGQFLEIRRNHQRSLEDSQRARFDLLRSYVGLFQALGYGYDSAASPDNPLAAPALTSRLLK